MKKILIPLLLISILNVTAQITPTWSNLQFGTGDNSDRYNAIVSDGLGNFYMGGYTFNTAKDKDYLLVKMNTAGDTLWTRRYNGLANGSDKILYMAIDVSGNVYTTGESDGGSINQTDIVTQKYNSSGVLQWTAIYNNSTANQNDQPHGISVDNSGNVFITGSSDRDSLSATINDDILTLKYTTTGTLSWSVIYNGTGNATDRGNSVIADNAGGCFITGRTATLVDDDVITINYSSIGTEIWKTIYNRGFGNDRGQNITIDGSGNSFVTGRAYNSSNYDLMTIKYNSLGVAQWKSFYDNADDDYGNRVKVDASGNVYVTGQSDVDASTNTNYDIVTIKYNSSGVLQWNKTFGNAALNDEDVNDVVVDAAGNVFVTGKSDVNSLASIVANNFITIKYNSTGAQQWAVYYDGTASNSDDIAEGFYYDGSTYLYVVGGTQNLTTQKDATIIKYAVSTGVSSWVKSYNGKGEFTDKVQAMIVDSKQNTFVTGYVFNPEMRRDLFLAKINSSGATVWFKTYDFSQDDDEGRAITLDTSKNIFVAGQSIGSGTSDDYITIKFDSLGNTLWTARYDFANEADVATAIAVNPSNGQVFVTGYSDANISSKVLNYDIATVKYSSLGGQLSTTRYNGSANGIDRPTEMAINASPLALSTYILVTGKSWNGTNYDIVTLKYGNGLGQQWASKYVGAANKDDESRDIYFDGTDSYVAGNSGSSSNGDDIVVVKYNSSGVQQWATTYNGSGNWNDIAYGITGNSSGIYVTGRTAPSSSGDTANLITLKYDKATGTQQWATIFNGTGNGLDRGNAISTDLFGNIYSAGESKGSGTSADIILLCYDPTGRNSWNARFNGAGNGDDVSRAISIDALGYLYVAGYAYGSGTAGFDAITLKYCPPPPVYAGADVSICPGSSTQLLATGGTTYLWSPSTGLSSTTISNPVANPSVTTSYVVTADNGLGCTRNDTVKVSTNSSSIGGTATATPTAVCSGSTSVISLTGNVGSIQWQNSTNNISFTNIAGATSSSYTTPGLTVITYYRASVTDGSCASVFSSTATVTINPVSIGGTAVANPVSLCGNGAVTITLTGFTGSIQWQSSTDNLTFTDISGATSSTYFKSKQTVTTYYKAKVTNGSCAAAFSNTATVVVNPKATATITASGSLAICAGDSVILTANSCTCTYQWKKGSNILAGETNNSYTAKTAGTFKVTVTTDKGCSKTSTGKSVTIVCKNEDAISINESEFSIFASPNPSATSFNIEFISGSTDAIYVEVFNVLGEKVYTAKPIVNKSLSLGNELPSGVYILKALQGNQQKEIKLIKQDQ
ncbi:MAG: SBBP repeat-containing protein [Chitinophagales bacterium]|nr:SBBP repeat-containing protein [Chitinophagales bacterium]